MLNLTISEWRSITKGRIIDCSDICLKTIKSIY